VSQHIFEKLYASRPSHAWPVDRSQVAGYSEEELTKIEKLYDIKIKGDFRQFMRVMGRCSGGLLGDDPIVLYRSLWSVRAQILFQVRFISDMQDASAFEYLSKPFVFSWESETQYFFMITDSDTPDRVYHYDENNQTVRKTETNFTEYLLDVIQRYAGQGRNAVCRGELLTL
jgi:SMI1-KNR4 cell-wall